MIIWISAFVLLVCLGLVGYYQGALRVGISTVGLLLAAVLAIPFSPVVSLILPAFGIHHPVVLTFVSPLIMYLIILIAFKATGHAIHKKVSVHYKNYASDTKRMLWERLNSRVGICLGVLNGTIYIILLSVVAYVVGYFTYQIGSNRDNLAITTANKVAEGLKATRMDKAVAAFVPTQELYYDSVDLISLIMHNPLLAHRLNTYPPFLAYPEKSEFSDFGRDTKFQEFWLASPSFAEFKGHDYVRPLLENEELYTNIVASIDLKDLIAYLETGKSPKFEDERILGHWKYDQATTFRTAKAKKPNMTQAENRALNARTYSLRDAHLTAYVDKAAVLKLPSTNNTVVAHRGTWKPADGGNYTLSINISGSPKDMPANFDPSSKLIVVRDGFNFYFDKN